jgi:hypothetical protein
LFFFFRYLEAISALHPVLVAAPAVASAMVARQNGHMVKLLLSNILQFCRRPIEMNDGDQNAS